MSEFGPPKSRVEVLLQDILGASYLYGAPKSRIEQLLEIKLGEDYDMLDPKSRIEALAKSIISGSGVIPEDLGNSRVELILRNMLGENNVLEPPKSRVEALLLEILNGGVVPPAPTYELKVVTGNAPLTLAAAVAKSIKSLTRFGKCEYVPGTMNTAITQYGKCAQEFTPMPDAPVDILCNNGAIKYGWHDIITTPALSGYGTYVSPVQAATTRAYRWFKDLPNGTYRFSVDGDYKIIVQWRDLENPADGTARFYENLSEWMTSGEVTLNKSTGGYGIAVRRTVGTSSITPSNFDGVLHIAENGLYAGGGMVGKNLANVNEQTALVGYYISTQGVVTADFYNWIYQDYIRVKPSTTYTLSISRSVYYVSISEYSTAEDSGFVIRKTGSTGSNTSLTITTNANTNFIRFGTNLDRTTVTLDKVLAINWQMEEGSMATEYEAYTEVPYLPETLTVSGVNLCAPAYYTGEGWYVASSNQVAAASSNGTLVFPCKPNTTYSWWHTDGVGGGRAFELTTDTVTQGQAATWAVGNPAYNDAMTVRKYTTSADAKLLCVLFARVDAERVGRTKEEQFADFMLVEGDIEEAFTYQPYVTPQTVTDIPPLLSAGDYKDEAKFIVGDVDRNVWAVVFDGSDDEPWQEYDGRFYIHTPNTQFPGLLGSGHIATPCTRFRPVATGFYGLADGDIEYSAGEQDIELYFTGASTVSELRTILSGWAAEGKPFIVCYPRETATEQTTAYPQLVNTKYNTASVTAEVDDIQVTFTTGEQTTPNQYSPLDIRCNNGVLTNNNGVIQVVGTPERITIVGSGVDDQTATVENLFSVGNNVDEHDLVSGDVNRACDVCVYNGTQNVGDIFMSTTGGKDVGAIIVYPSSSESSVTPQALTTAEGTNIASSSSNVTPAYMDIEYYGEAS